MHSAAAVVYTENNLEYGTVNMTTFQAARQGKPLSGNSDLSGAIGFRGGFLFDVSAKTSSERNASLIYFFAR